MPFIEQTLNQFPTLTASRLYANASANLYSLLQTCAVNGVDGYQYLRALLVALPKAQSADDYEALLPWSIGVAAD
jgi:hypothetical protein